MFSRVNIGIQGRLVVLILLGLLPVFILAILDSLSDRRAAIAASQDETQRLARLAAAKEGAQIEGAHQLTVALSTLPEVLRRDIPACNRLARKLLDAYPQYTNFGVVDAGGTVWCSSLPDALQIKLGDRDYVRVALDEGKSAVGGYQIGRLTGTPSIGYASPIIDASSKSVGAAFIALRVSAFGEQAEDGDMPEGAIYSVMDRNGTILQRIPDGPDFQGSDISRLALFRAALAKHSGSLDTKGVDGVERLYGYAWSHADANRRVMVTIGIPKHMIVEAPDRHMLLTLLTLLAVTAIALGAGTVASRRLILEPIMQLVKTTRRIAAYESNVRSNMRQRDELGELGREIDVMAESLERQRLEISHNEARFRDLTDLSSDWYWEQDEDFRFTEVSSNIGARSGINSTDHVGKTRWELPGIKLSDGEWERHKAMLRRHEAFDGFTYERTGPDGTTRHFRISGRPVFDAQGRFRGYRGVGKDVTEARIAEERIGYLAYHDALTGLPNRANFSMMLNHAIASARRDGRSFAILFLDLDGFKHVNDTRGHEAGDALLVEVGRRLHSSIRENDTAARLGGDEFVVLLEDVAERPQATVVAEKILRQIAEASQACVPPCNVTASIGISFFPGDGGDETVLMKNADDAMYRAKDLGKNRFEFHSLA